MGQPLSPTSREFKIKNVPANEYFVACVVSLEEMDIQVERYTCFYIGMINFKINTRL